MAWPIWLHRWRSGEADEPDFARTDWTPLVKAWNERSFWNRHYAEHLRSNDPAWRHRRIHRPIDRLVEMLQAAGELPCQAPRRILDAGCGMTSLPHMLRLWGFDVTALDISTKAIAIARQLSPSEDDLAACLPIWEPHPTREHCRICIDDPVRSRERFRALLRPGGSLVHQVGDWLRADLPTGSFHLIHCAGGLRCSRKSYWRTTLRRFRDLLAPGGLLLLESVNAIGIMEEAEGLIADCGLVPWRPGEVRDAGKAYIRTMWPTG